MAMSSGSKAQINVTPMIDVLLVLIIIFMIITPLIPRGLHALVPQAGRESTPPTHDIVVTVRGDGTVRLNQEPVDLASLHDRLALLFGHTSRVIFVRAERGLEFQQVVRVIDIARGVGLDRVALMTQ